MSRRLGEGHGEAGHTQSDQRHQHEHAPLDDGLKAQPDQPDRSAEDGGPKADGDSPQEHDAVRRPKGGRPGMESEKRPNPASESSPMKIRVPTPAAKSPGTSTTPIIGPPSPDASDQEEGGEER